MKGSIRDRLTKIINHYDLNSNSLSKKLSLPSNSVITRIMNDPNPERGISLKLIQKVLLNFPDINPGWLVMNEGAMFITKGEQTECLDCLSKEKEIEDLRKDLIELQKQYIECLKEVAVLKHINSG